MATAAPGRTQPPMADIAEPDRDALAEAVPQALSPPPVVLPAAPSRLEAMSVAVALPAAATPELAKTLEGLATQPAPSGLGVGLAAAPGHAVAAPTASPPPPARQVAQLAIALAFSTDPRAGFTLALAPAELGRVEIRLQREGEGQSLRITAERPETLALLMRDRAELNRDLTEAGLRLDAGGLTFSLEGDAPTGQQPHQQRGGQGRRGEALRADAPPPPLLLRRSLLDLNI